MESILFTTHRITNNWRVLLRVYTRQDENLILENKIRVDHFGEQYVDANTIVDLPTIYPIKKEGMYIDNGATGALVYIVARNEMEDRFAYLRETSVEIMFKEDGKWQGGTKTFWRLWVYLLCQV